jgi:uncharacterized membrane protein
MNREQNGPIFVMGTRRIEALTDGVFAIAMTLLIFGVDIPIECLRNR